MPLPAGLGSANVANKAAVRVLVTSSIRVANRQALIAADTAPIMGAGALGIDTPLVISMAVVPGSQQVTLSIDAPSLREQLMGFGVPVPATLLPFNLPLDLSLLLGSAAAFVPPRLINAGIFLSESTGIVTIRLEFDPLDSRQGRSAEQRAARIVVGWNEFYRAGSLLIPARIVNNPATVTAISLSDALFERFFRTTIETSFREPMSVSTNPPIVAARDASSPMRFQRRGRRFRIELDIWMQQACLPLQADLAVTMALDVVLSVRDGMFVLDAFVDAWVQPGSLTLCILLNALFAAALLALAVVIVGYVVGVIFAAIGAVISEAAIAATATGVAIAGAVTAGTATGIAAAVILGIETGPAARRALGSSGLQPVPGEPRHFRQTVPLPPTSVGATGASLQFVAIDEVTGGVALVGDVVAPSGRGRLSIISRTELPSGTPALEWRPVFPPIGQPCDDTVAVATHEIRCENAGNAALRLCPAMIDPPFTAIPGATIALEVASSRGSGTVAAPASWMTNGVPPMRQFFVVVRVPSASIEAIADRRTPLRVLIRSSDGARIITMGNVATLPPTPTREELVLQCHLARSNPGPRAEAAERAAGGRSIEALFRFPARRPDPRPSPFARAAALDRAVAAMVERQWLDLAPGSPGPSGRASIAATESFEWSAPIAKTRSLPGFSTRV
jgi:hypothetical protein